jgi:predicted metalloprotease with PDZ domain
VRLTRIDDVDLSLFAFDYDVTMMVFFLDAEENVYARYGGRDPDGPDARQSLEGLRHTMQSVLAVHEREEKEYAPRPADGPKSVRDLRRARGGCMHCHQVKEAINADLRRSGKWSRDLVWRYPLPENLGLALEVDRGNVDKHVEDGSAAAAAGLKAGDVLRKLDGVPVHSFGDAQFALDAAPKAGSVEVVWQRGDDVHKGKVSLAEGWRKTDVSWRPSVRHLVAQARLYGEDLTAEQKKALGLDPKQLAFRQRELMTFQAKSAGIRPGDVILGVDGVRLETDVTGFLRYVQSNYLVGDKVTVNLLRDGKRLEVPMDLIVR